MSLERERNMIAAVNRGSAYSSRSVLEIRLSFRTVCAPSKSTLWSLCSDRGIGR